MWFVDDRFVMLNQRGFKSDSPGTWYVLSSVDGLAWEENRFPLEVDEYDDISAGTADGGQISLLARLDGRSDAPWEFVSSADGREWTTAGPVDIPMKRYQDPGLLVRTNDGWLATRTQSWLDEMLWESTDGTHWSPAAPQLPHRALGYVFLTRFGSATLAFAEDSVTDDGTPIAAAVRRDGETAWTTSEFSLPAYSFVEQIACRTDGCVAVGMIDEQAAAWHSSDGLNWATVEIENPVGAGWPRPGAIVASDAGFVILSERTGHAWISTNGTDWRLIQTQTWDFDDPAVFPDYIGRAVTDGDLIVALGAKADGPESGDLVLWLGRFSEMPR